MRILLPTGSATFPLVCEASAGFDADVVVTGEIASFLTPAGLGELLKNDHYDLVIVSGMSTASFEEVEREYRVPIYRGPRHAADLKYVLSLLDSITLSRTVPADEFLSGIRKKDAMRQVFSIEESAEFDYLLRSVKIGGNSRIKVIAEIMDAHKEQDIRSRVEQYFSCGADIVDLGFGFDATPLEVEACFLALDGIEGPLAVDTQDPRLISAALKRADLVLSLSDANIPHIGKAIADAGTGVVIVPGEQSLQENIAAAEQCGISCIIADPLIPPVGSGLVESLSRWQDIGYPLFFGAGNVVELLDADSIGANALLAGMAMEVGAAVIFTSEHSDKTSGSVREMHRATEMMALMKDRPYPKDLGIDLLVIKEKRKRREPPLQYDQIIATEPLPEELVYDPCGNFRIGIENGEIFAIINEKAYHGSSWADLFHTIQINSDISRLDHAAYLGKELYKAELALRFGRSFEQDGTF